MPILQQRDLAATRLALEGWLAPILGTDQVAVDGLEPPAGTGFSNETLVFRASWVDDAGPHGRDLVARLRPDGYAVFPDVDVPRQAAVMEALAPTPIPVPEIVARDDEGLVLGAPLFVMGKVDGRIPPDNPPYTMDGWVLEEPPEQVAAMMGDAIDTLAAVHRLDPWALGLGFLDQPELGSTPWAQHLAYTEWFLGWASDDDPPPVVAATWDWVRAHAPDAAGLPVGLVWGDARIGNMIFRDGRVQAVLDWEMARLGAPEEDLGWWLFLQRHHSDGVGVPLPAGMPDRAATVARWEDRVGRPAVDVDFWELFAGLRFGIVMLRITQALVDAELIPADTDMARNNTVTQLLAKMLDLPAPS
jgi:aminoglycoside phosphotransferase (APT) family kinase protein